MIVSELFAQINDSYRGTDDEAPAEGSDDFSYWLRVTNRKINEWAKDTNNVWESLWEEKTLQAGLPLEDVVIVAGTQDYTIPDGLIALSDEIIVGEDKFQIVKAKERNRFNNAVYIVGNTLTFIDEITAESEIVGKTIKVPGYWLPSELETDVEEIVVDDPYWVVYAVATDLALNDLTYSAKAGNLANQANSLYKAMVKSNRRGTNNNPRITPTKVTRIGNAQY